MILAGLGCTPVLAEHVEVEAVTVLRHADEVDVSGVLAGHGPIAGHFALASGTVHAVLSGAVGQAWIEVDPHGPGAVPASGTAEDSGHRLEVVAEVVDGAATSWAVLDGQVFDLGDAAGAATARQALAQTSLGQTLQRWLPFRDKVPARLAEAASVFDLAALCGPALCAQPAVHRLRVDRVPPGALEGDTVGLGTTCSDWVRCPGQAPVCVTDDHDAAWGFCTRSCVVDDDCVQAEATGTCTLDVVDIPGVDHGVRSCELPCEADLDCPGLLMCGDRQRCGPAQ